MRSFAEWGKAKENIMNEILYLISEFMIFFGLIHDCERDEREPH